MNEPLESIQKVWGEEIVICNTPLYAAKWLHIEPFYTCSDHFHPTKDEMFHVITGSGVICKSGQMHVVKVGDTIHIPANTRHYFATATGMTLLEVSTHHDDDDVVRRAPSHRLTAKDDEALWEALGLG